MTSLTGLRGLHSSRTILIGLRTDLDVTAKYYGGSPPSSFLFRESLAAWRSFEAIRVDLQGRQEVIASPGTATAAGEGP